MQPQTDFPIDLRALASSYQLIRELGQGGMAAVYLARRRDSGQQVAIKAIRGRYADDPDAIQRFAREARTVADLSHPNIVRTEAIEEIGDRAVAIVMEYVAGGTVRDRLRKLGAFSAEDAEAVLCDVASALGYAHRRGIVHRDVKPENVFLDEQTGRALLSDFGIARRMEGDAPITMLGAALGTPQYMSPEQIDGREVDGRSDIYSLGVLGWELLSGQRPWVGENLYGVIYKQKHEELPKIMSLRPRVPANLLFAIEGALVKDRARRWQSVHEFLDQLTQNAAPAPVPARDEPVPAVDDERTVEFRRAPAPPAPPAIPPAPAPAPNEPPAARRAEVPVAAPNEPPAPRKPEPARGTGGRRRVLPALALIALLAIAGGSWYVLLGGRAPSKPAAPASRTTSSSAGTVARDSSRRRDTSAAKRAPQEVPDPVRSKKPEPVRPKMPEPIRARTPEPERSTATPATSPPVAAAPKSNPRTRRPASPSARCAAASMADQRACFMAYLAVNDAALQVVYDSVIRDMRRRANVSRGAPDPPSVRRLRAEQRTWVVTRDRECTRTVVPGSVQFWAEPLSRCFARVSAARRDALTAVGNRE